MPQPRFEPLRERLLRAGIAPRHVRRYIAELRDHFDDLVREEIDGGAVRYAAEAKARARIGCDEDLADIMLERPELRSLTARYPWAVFGIGPVAMVVAAVVGAVSIEIAMFSAAHAMIPHPAAAQREAFVSLIEAWNWLTIAGAPLAIAALLCVIGLRQRVAPVWIFTGIAIACILGAFPVVQWSDDGRHGELTLASGLLPPFPAKLVPWGIYRAVVTFALAAAIYGLGIRRQIARTPAPDRGAPLAAE